MLLSGTNSYPQEKKKPESIFGYFVRLGTGG